MPEYSRDWFNHHIPDWRVHFRLAKWDAETPKVAVEIGSFEGRATIWLLENQLLHPDSVIHCVDTFAGGMEHKPELTEGLFGRFVRNIGQSGHAKKVRIHRQPSSKALVDLIQREVRADFVYIDGSHQAPDVLSDLVLSFQILKPGGLLVCDDYIWTQERAGSEDVLNSPKIAIDAFTTIYRRKTALLAAQRLVQLAMLKTQD